VLRTADFALLACRLLLAFVFLLAGAAKLVDPVGLRKSWRDFGLPAFLAPAAILLLPLAELAVAVALIPARLAWYGACGALALLSGFLLAIAIAMLRGRRPDCRCFGRLHSAPVGRFTLIRDGAFAACATSVVLPGRFHAQPDLWTWLGSLNGDERKIAVIAGCLGGFVFFRMLDRARPKAAAPPEPAEIDEDDTPLPRPARRRAVLPPPPPELPPSKAQGIGLPVGAPAPPFELPALTGEKCSLESLRAPGREILLVFSSPFCEPCHALMPHLARWARERKESLNIVVISRGSVADNRAKLKDFDPARILLQQIFEISEAYDCSATPTALLIDADGRIASELATGRAAIQKLLQPVRDGAGTTAKLPE